MVYDDRRRVSMSRAKPLVNLGHAQAGDRLVDMDGLTLTGVVISDGQQSEPAPVHELIGQEIQRSALPEP